MGCLMSKRSKRHQNSSRSSLTSAGPLVGELSNKQYSWSNRKKQDLSRFVIDNVIDSVIVRMPNEIDGQPMVIQNCTRAIICLFDHSNTVTIDDCTECILFIGPVKGSIAMRNCDNCRLMSASQQFRTRDCKLLDLFLFCGTQPAIESCAHLRIGCFAANYHPLREQFIKSNLNLFNNKWCQVYDFSIDDHERHWNTFPTDIKAQDFFSTVPEQPTLNLSFDAACSLVPQTAGLTSLEFLQNFSEKYIASSFESNEQVSPLVSTTVEESPHFCILFLFSSEPNPSLVELEVERFLHTVQSQHSEKLILLMTKQFSEDQVAIKWRQIVEDEDESSSQTKISQQQGEQKQHRKEAKNNQPPKHLYALFYQGDQTIGKVLADNCESVFHACPQHSPCVDMKIVAHNQESNFAHLLTLAFENMISY